MPKVVDHEQRRMALSAIAADLIADGGLEAATIREIAAASGYSKGVVEHYFVNKDELISGALAFANHRLEQRAAEYTKGLAGLTSLRRRIEATLPLSREIRNEWKVRLVFWARAAIEPSLKQQQAGRFSRAVEFYEREITVALDAGEIALAGDSWLRARHLVNMTTGISVAALHNDNLYSRPVQLEEVDYLVEGLRLGNI